MSDVVIKVVGESDSSEIDKLVKSLEGLGPQIVEAMRDVKPAAEAATKAVKDVGDEGERSGGKLSKLGGMLGGLGKAAMVGGAALGVAAVGAAVVVNDLVGAAEAMGDAQAKVDIALGSSADRVTEFLDVANGLGMTKTQFLEVAGGLGQLATSLGVTQDKAASMAENFTELGPQLAAFAGVEKEVASDALEKALLGKTKGLAALGIAITDADIKAAAMREGIKGEAKDWTEAQVAQVNYAAVMEKTKDAQAAWADNSGDVEVSMQRVSAAIEDAKAALGEKLLPLIAPLVESFANKLPGAIDTLMGIIGPAFDGIGAGADAVMGFVADLRAAWETDWGGIRSAIEGVIAWWNENVQPSIDDTIAAITDSVSGFSGDWGDTWKTIEGYVKTFLDWWNANVAPTIDAVIGYVQSALAYLADWWKANSETIVNMLTAAWNVISNVFGAAFTLIKGIVSAGLALIRGDFSGAAEFIRTAIADAVPKIVAAFMNLLSMLGNAAMALGPMLRDLFWKALEVVKSVFVGGVSLVAGAIAGLVQGIINAFKSALGISSPSKVFMELGGYIVSGLKQGLVNAWSSFQSWFIAQMGDIKDWAMKALGIASPSTVFAEIGEWIVLGLASGIQKADFKAVSALADVISKMNAVISGAQDFAKKLVDFVVPSADDIRDAKGKFLQLLVIMQDFAKDYAYLGALLPVQNTAQASDLQQRVIQIKLDELAAQYRDIRELQGLKVKDLLTGGEADWAGKLNDMIGKMASAWGSMADNLTKMASAKFPTPAQIESIKVAALGILMWTADIIQRGTMPVVVGVEDFAAVMKAAADALNSIAALNLSDITAVTADQLAIAKMNIERVAVAAGEIVGAWFRDASTAPARKVWIDGLQDFAATIGAAASILKAGDVGDLSKVVPVPADLTTLKDNLTAVAKFAGEVVGAWFRDAGTADARAAWIESLKSFADMMAAAVDVLKVAAIGEVEAALTVNIDAARDVLVQVRDVLAPMIMAIVDAWQETVESAAPMTEKMKAFNDWIGAALSIARASVVGEVQANILVNGRVMEAILIWMRNDFVPMIQAIAMGWQETVESAKPLTERMKAFADWINAAVGIAKATVIGELHANILVNGQVMEAILIWLRDTFVPMVQGVVSGWGGTAESAKPLVEKMQAFASMIGAVTGIASALSGLSAVKAGVVNAGAIQGLAAQARLVLDAIFGEGGLVKGITVEAATAATAALGAIEAGAGALSAVGNAIMTMLDNPFVDSPRRPRNSSVMRGAAKTRIQAMADNLREGIKLALATIQEALRDVSIDTTKLDALNALGDAFASLAGALRELSSKDIDLKRITAALGGLPLLAGGGMGAGGGMAGAMTINAGSVTLAGASIMFPPVTADVMITSTPIVQIGGQTIETLATIIERKLADRFMLGIGSGGPPPAVPFNGARQAKAQGRRGP